MCPSATFHTDDEYQAVLDREVMPQNKLRASSSSAAADTWRRIGVMTRWSDMQALSNQRGC
jgi:hypothetical protein